MLLDNHFTRMVPRYSIKQYLGTVFWVAQQLPARLHREVPSHKRWFDCVQSNTRQVVDEEV